MRADLCQHRDSAEIGRCRLGQYRAVHDLSGALAGYSEVHDVPPARISEVVFQWRLSAQYAADDRPVGAGTAAGRGAGGGRALKLHFWLVHQADVSRNHAPAFREFHPSLHLTAELAG